MSPEEQKAFMADIGGLNITQIRALIESKYQKITQHGTYYDNGGQYLPPSVYEKMGYDPVAIKALTPSCDRVMHPILGETFRLAILTTGQRGYRGSENSESMSKRPKNT